jgi:hypothetical protein
MDTGVFSSSRGLSWGCGKGKPARGSVGCFVPRPGYGPDGAGSVPGFDLARWLRTRDGVRGREGGAPWFCRGGQTGRPCVSCGWRSAASGGGLCGSGRGFGGMRGGCHAVGVVAGLVVRGRRVGVLGRHSLGCPPGPTAAVSSWCLRRLCVSVVVCLWCFEWSGGRCGLGAVWGLVWCRCVFPCWSGSGRCEIGFCRSLVLGRGAVGCRPGGAEGGAGGSGASGFLCVAAGFPLAGGWAGLRRGALSGEGLVRFRVVGGARGARPGGLGRFVPFVWAVEASRG